MIAAVLFYGISAAALIYFTVSACLARPGRERRMTLALAAFVAAVLAIVTITPPRAKAQSPSKKEWYERLEIPEAARKRMGVFYKSCCDRGDLFKTRFRVNARGDDQWEYQESDGSWRIVPPDIILDTPSLDGEPRLFKRIGTGEPLCFVKPNGGI